MLGEELITCTAAVMKTGIAHAEATDEGADLVGVDEAEGGMVEQGLHVFNRLRQS